MIDNNPLYALSILVKSYRLLLAYILALTIIFFAFHSWYTSKNAKMVKFDIQNSQSIRLHLSNTDRTTLSSLGFAEETLFKIIKDLSSSEAMQKKVLIKTFDLDNENLNRNLESIYNSYSIQIDRKNKDEELKKYIVSFKTLLNENQSQLFIKNLIVEAHEQLQRNVITNLLFEIRSINRIINTADTIYKEAIDKQIKNLEILDRNFIDNKKLNREKSIEILKNNLQIAEAAGFVDIQNQVFLSNLFNDNDVNFSQQSNISEDVFNNLASNNITQKVNERLFELLSADSETLAGEVYGLQKNKYINTSDELQSHSSNKPLYLLGVNILKKEIELLENKKYESLNSSMNKFTASNILNELLQTGEASEIKIEKRKLNALQDLDRAISDKGLFNINENIYLINYYPSSFTYSLILPNRNYLIIFSIFIGIIVTIFHLIISAAVNYKRE